MYFSLSSSNQHQQHWACVLHPRSLACSCNLVVSDLGAYSLARSITIAGCLWIYFLQHSYLCQADFKLDSTWTWITATYRALGKRTWHIKHIIATWRITLVVYYIVHVLFTFNPLHRHQRGSSPQNLPIRRRVYIIIVTSLLPACWLKHSSS